MGGGGTRNGAQDCLLGAFFGARQLEQSINIGVPSLHHFFGLLKTEEEPSMAENSFVK